MADKRPTPSKPDEKSRKKVAETVQLSAEDLRKISGGATNPKPPPIPTPDIIKKQ
jgi:hypothetical protein